MTYQDLKIGNMLRSFFNKPYKLYSLLLLTSASMGCQQSPESTLNDLSIDHILTPIAMFSDSLSIPLHEISLSGVHFHKASLPELSAEWHSDKEVLSLKRKQRNTALYSLKLYEKDIPYIIPVYCKEDTTEFEFSNQIKCLSADKQRITLEKVECKTLMVLWHNLQLEIEETDSSISVQIPPFAKYIENTRLTA